MSLLTTDIYEGAYLLSQGMRLEKLWLKENNTKRSVVFEFSGASAEILRHNYEKGSAETNVIKLKQSITELKDCMFNLLRAKSGAEIPIESSGRRKRYESNQSCLQV